MVIYCKEQGRLLNRKRKSTYTSLILKIGSTKTFKSEGEDPNLGSGFGVSELSLTFWFQDLVTSFLVRTGLEFETFFFKSWTMTRLLSPYSSSDESRAFSCTTLFSLVERDFSCLGVGLEFFGVFLLLSSSEWLNPSLSVRNLARSCKSSEKLK